VQNEVSRQLLATIGIREVTIVGDTRFDRVLQIKEQAKELPMVEAFVQDAPRMFVAGSSWPPDEDIFIRYFKEHPGWKLIIAPHVIAEDHLQQIIGKLDDNAVVRYTDIANNQQPIANCRDARVLIVDCFGLLSSIYRYATVCYVGGGFGVSIHNTVEAAVWGKPVIFGPENQKFQEAQELKSCGGGLEIKDYDDFCSIMDRFSSDETVLQQAGHAAGDYVKKRAGATGKILAAAEL
jgi:3-deoxy-D-manno-octulosonic-acid transferase